MAWTPIHESGIGYNFVLDDGISVTDSVVTGAPNGVDEPQHWTLNLDTPHQVRVTVLSFNSSPYPNSGAFLFDADSVLNGGGTASWIPNPIESSGDVSTVIYEAGEQSDYPVDTYEMLVEVFVAPAAVARATVTVTVQGTVSAGDDSFSTDAETAITFSVEDLLANDTANGAPATLELVEFEIVSQPANGTLVDNGDGTLTYTPNEGFCGPDPFEYEITNICQEEPAGQGA